MKKPYARCYDMECDECPERGTCIFADSAESIEPPPEDNYAVAMAKLAGQVKELSRQLETLAVIIRESQERFDRIIAFIVRAANEDDM